MLQLLGSKTSLMVQTWPVCAKCSFFVNHLKDHFMHEANIAQLLVVNNTSVNENELCLIFLFCFV